MSLSINPIFAWPLVVVLGLVALGLTVATYLQRLRGSEGWRPWLLFGLRMAALALCLMAMLRPSVVLSEKVKQNASLVFLVDGSTSMTITDEVGGRSRRDVAQEALDRAREAVATLGPDVDVRFYRFGPDVKDFSPDEPPTDDAGRETAIGSALLEVLKQQAGVRLASIVLLSDGASNGGLPPMDAAERLKSQQVPVVAVGFGSSSAGAGSRDLAVRELVVPSTVYNKNQAQVRGALRVRGYPNSSLDVELDVEGITAASKALRAPEGQEVVSVSGLSFTPQTPGEKRVTLKVKPKEGELVRTNNEYSTYVTVLSGGLNVLYLQGPNFSHEYRFLVRALDASPEIQADLKVLRAPTRGDRGELDDADLAGKYDVYILGDLPADRLTRNQQNLLVQAVRRGAGLMLLGGRDSFGAGGWAATPLADILPVAIHPGDGQIEPGEAGLKVVPHPGGTDDYLMQIGPSQQATADLWAQLPPINGANRFGPPKRGARVLADAPGGDPLMVAMDVPQGRVLAFGGETWPWARAAVLSGGDAIGGAHKKFWRQAILWLAHKEDDNQSQVKLALDRRRVALGQKLDLTASARDAKGAPILDAEFSASVAPEGIRDAAPERVELVRQGEQARGSHYAIKAPGEYRVTVTARRAGEDLGSASARFIVYVDDVEMSNPAADPALLRRIAETTGGKFLPPEQLAEHIKGLDTSVFTDYTAQAEHRLWDNWPFFLIFTAILSLEWWLRKRQGWV